MCICTYVSLCDIWIEENNFILIIVKTVFISSPLGNISFQQWTTKQKEIHMMEIG